MAANLVKSYPNGTWLVPQDAGVIPGTERDWLIEMKFTVEIDGTVEAF